MSTRFKNLLFTLSLVVMLLAPSMQAAAAGAAVNANPALSVPYIDQYQNKNTRKNDCGPASVAMVVQYHGKRPPNLTNDAQFIVDIRSKMGKTGNVSTGSNDRRKALQAYGIASTILTSASTNPLQDIKNALAQGKPVIARVNGRDLGRGYDGHAIVVTGFSSDGKWVYVNDPDNQSKYMKTSTPGGRAQWPVALFEKAMKKVPSVNSEGYALIVENPVATPTPPPAIPAPKFEFPVDGQVLDFEGYYILQVFAVNGATGYRWSFEQNGQLIWDNERDEGKLDGVTYVIAPDTTAHNRFVTGAVKVIARAQVDGKWSEPGVITIQLVPRNTPVPTTPPSETPTPEPTTPPTETPSPEPTTPPTETPTPEPAQPSSGMVWPNPSVEKGQNIIAEFPFDPQGQPVSGVEYACTFDAARLEYQNATVSSAFGANPVFIPQAGPDGSLLLVAAGSNGQVMTGSGKVFEVEFKTLEAGQVSIQCAVKYPKNANQLQDVPFTTASLTIKDVTPPTPPTPPSNVTVSGQITLTNQAYSSAKISARNAAGEEVASVTPDANGNFQVMLPAGEYAFIASAPGFLSAQRSGTVSANLSLPAVSLLAGDINQDGKINALDVVTLGNLYKKSPLTIPAADLTGDSLVNLLDLLQLAANYLKTGPLDW